MPSHDKSLSNTFSTKIVNPPYKTKKYSNESHDDSHHVERYASKFNCKTPDSIRKRFSKFQS